MPSTEPVSQFWRDPALPFIEAQGVADGRKVCYSRHSHAGFSIGAITAGRSTYITGDSRHEIHAGTVVMMNPGVVHACNPIAEEPWSYVMLYVDMPWLAALDFQPVEATHSTSAALFADLMGFYWQLTDAELALEDKRATCEGFFRDLRRHLAAAPAPAPGNERLERAAGYIREHCTEPLKLPQIAEAAGLSTSYLIRAFKQHYGMTPHGFLLDQRVQFARARLREGQLIADVALEAGFADQAHLQRAFKHFLAVTPGYYRSAQ